MLARDTRLMASQCIPLFLRALERHGVDPRQVTRRFSLPDECVQWPEISVPLRTLWAISDDCARLCDDSLIGFHLATSVERGSYGLLEFVARSAPTLNDAFLRLVRYSTLVNELVMFELEDVKEGVLLRHSVPGEPLAVGRQCNEYFIALAVHVARQLVGREFRPVKAWLAHPDSEGTQLRDFLGCKLAMGAGHNGLIIAQADLDRPIASADPALLRVLDQQAERVAKTRPQRSGLVPRVRELLREALPQGGSAIDRVATRMHMSARTLQRRLADEDTTLQRLAEQLRHEVAVEMVAENKSALGEIAFVLGYSDLRAFGRAFRRWTGTTPGAARAMAKKAG